MAITATDLNGREKAAILLIALGKENSAELFKHLKDEDIEQLTLEITNMRRVDPEIKDMVLDEFYKICLAKNFISEGGIDYAREILESAIGNQKAFDVINKLTSSLQVKPFDFVRKTDPNQLLNFIQHESPQTIALIFSYLDPGQAGAVLAALPHEMQTEIVERIAMMDRTSPEYIREIERILERKLSSMGSQDYTIVGGIQTIVEIINSVDRGTEKNILTSLEAYNPELVDEIRKRMFVFEDIAKLESRFIQRVLKEVDNADLTVALKNTAEEVRATIFNNMSKRLKEMIEEDMSYMGPVRLRDVEEAQQKIVNIVRRLEESGEIFTARGQGDELIV